jgi:hypothetical protein
MLTPHDSVVALTGYGTNGRTAPLPRDTVFFDFAAAKDQSWSNNAGKLTVVSRNVTVKTSQRTYEGCIAIRHQAGGSKFLYTFAPGVGFVQFGEGKDAFVLDEAASGGRESGIAAPTPAVPDSRRPSTGPLLGVTVNTFAVESDAPENLLKRFDQSVNAGIKYVSGAGKWTELEPSNGNFKLDSIDFQAHLAQSNGAKMSFTLRLIDTIHKAVPSDLMNKGWMDPEMQKRVLRLVDAMLPVMHGRVQWFMFGNEVDGYFDRHPNEIADFVRLYDLVAARVKSTDSGIRVATTVMFGGIDKLKGPLQPLNDRFDFISLTYYPMKPDFTVQDPDAPLRDLPRMKAMARGRQIVLQEIGYPTGAANKSDEEMQARFFRNVFDQMGKDPGTFAAGSVFLLADLRDKFATELAGYYGINGYEPFRSYLQTLGMFDKSGRAKKSWSVFQSALSH